MRSSIVRRNGQFDPPEQLTDILSSQSTFLTDCSSRQWHISTVNGFYPNRTRKHHTQYGSLRQTDAADYNVFRPEIKLSGGLSDGCRSYGSETADQIGSRELNYFI